jgi:lipopolysaccharide transport system ATP-binding protein
MSSELVVRVSSVKKGFRSYDRPQDRLKQGLLSLASRVAPIPSVKAELSRRASACARTFWALQDVSFDVHRGETIGIIGRNGSGKSTLLQIVCGTLAPTEGEVSTRGRVAALLELGSGFNPEFTGRENVFLNGQLHGLTHEQIAQRFDEIVAFADIGDFIDQPVKTYSSGMFVRLAFAVIAHVDADVLIIDEALAVGDAFFTQKCMRFLRKFKEQGTVLFVSHDTSSVRNLCTRAIWIEKGVILESGDPKEVCNRYLEAFYEAQQGKSTTTRLRARENAQSSPPLKDQRLTFINQSKLRNDIELFKFDPDAPSFGKGSAHIMGVEFLDETGHRLTWIVGGETVILRITVHTERAISSPIVGFFVKDKLGQTLFGDNTYLTYRDVPVECQSDSLLVADFTFTMPILIAGTYSVNAAVAEGTQENHVQLHWIHDALMFRSESSSVSTGLMGIPMRDISLGAHSGSTHQILD